MNGLRRWAALALVAVPVAVVASHVWLARAITPLWMGGSTDPTYAYLLNALLVAEGRPPVLATHPGTPLDVLGAGVLHVAHALSGSTLGLREHVLRDPETFVGAIRAALLALFALAEVFLGWAAWRLTGSVACAAAVQACPLASFVASRTMAQVMTEPLLMILGAALSGWILVMLCRGPDTRSPFDVPVLGALVGLGVATKLFFAPAALVPLAALGTARRRWAFVACAVLAFAAAIAPLGPGLVRSASWVWGSLSHTGVDSGGFGLGPAGFLDARLFASGLAQGMRGETVVLGLSAAALVVALTLGRHVPAEDAILRRCLLAAVAAQALVLLGAAKSMGPHHLVAAASLSGLVVCLSYRLADRSLERRPRALAAAALAVAALLAARHAHLLGTFVEQRAAVRPGARAAEEAARRLGGDRVIQGYCVSTLASNLAMANEWTLRAFTADLERLHPDAVFFDWAGLHRFGRPVGVGELASRVVDGDSLVLWDTAWFPHEAFGYFRGLQSTPLGSWGRDRLLRASLLPLAADRVAPAGAPPFAGAVFLSPSVGFARPLPGGTPPDLAPLGPTTRLAVLGRGRPLRLAAEGRLEQGEDQVLRFLVDGLEVGRHAITAAEGWRPVAVDLPARSGLFELAIHYERLWTSEIAARPMHPGYGDVHPEVRWPAVRYRKLQVWATDVAPASPAPPE